MNRSTRILSFYRGILWSLLFLILAGCRPSLDLPAAARAAGQHLPSGRLSRIPREGNFLSSLPQPKSPEPILLANLALLDQPSETPTPTLEPFVLTFPTPVPLPESGLLPPLYPVPWALTPSDHFYFTRPISADRATWAQEDYRYGGIFFEDVVHSGIDIPARVGTPVLAAGSGKVTWAGYGINSGVYDPEDPYGKAVFIRHDFGFQGYTLYTLYAHLDRVDVQKGDRIEAGHILGASGETGKATGPHLHFEIRLGKAGQFVTRNPELWLVPPQGWGLLAGRVMNNTGRLLEGQLVSVVPREGGLVRKSLSYTQGGMVESDAYYQENLVISDLPAGRYDIQINLWGKRYTLEIDILPGQVSYFTFRGQSGFTLEPLALPGADFTPSP